MTTYNTGNPVPSADVKDFYDNAENLDNAVNGVEDEWTDRTGAARKTWKSIEKTSQDILAAGGHIYESEEAGRDAVADGEYYYVVGREGGYAYRVLYRRIDATESERIGTDERNAESIVTEDTPAGYRYRIVTDDGFVVGEFVGDGDGHWEFVNLRANEMAPEFLNLGGAGASGGDSSNPFSIVTDTGEVIANLESDGTLKAPAVSASSYSSLNDGVDPLKIVTELGEVIASLDARGTLKAPDVSASSYSAVNEGAGPLAIVTEQGEIIAFLDADGALHVPSVSAGSHSPENDGIEPFKVVTKYGEIIASLDSGGVLSAPKINAQDTLMVNGLPFTGGGSAVGEPIAKPFSDEAIALINSLDITKGDGSPRTDNAVGVKLSNDSSLYGPQFAMHGPSIKFFGNRAWIAYWGQNTRPGEKAEWLDGYVTLAYCDDVFAQYPEWNECLYMVPAEFGVESNDILEPHLSELPDGRLFVQAGQPELGAEVSCFGFIVDNPRAVNGCFNVGRLFWVANGMPSRAKMAAGKYLVCHDIWARYVTEFREVTSFDSDILDSSLLLTVTSTTGAPLHPAETCWVPLSGNRINVLQRSQVGNRHYQTTSEPGLAGWSQVPERWDEYSSNATKSNQIRSASGRIVRVWNNSDTNRRSLTVALSEDEAESFQYPFMFRDREGAQGAQYPTVDSIEYGGEVYLAIIYTVGRTNIDPNHRVELAIMKESDVVSGAATIANTKYTTITTAVKDA